MASLHASFTILHLIIISHFSLEKQMFKGFPSLKIVMTGGAIDA
jgi:hypothetical protein